MESVIAIGIVAVLLTTFLAVFGPATQGIRRAISIQEADRLVSALEREMQVLRSDDDDSGCSPTTAGRARTRLLPLPALLVLQRVATVAPGEPRSVERGTSATGTTLCDGGISH